MVTILTPTAQSRNLMIGALFVQGLAICAVVLRIVARCLSWGGKKRRNFGGSNGIGVATGTGTTAWTRTGTDTWTSTTDSNGGSRNKSSRRERMRMRRTATENETGRSRFTSTRWWTCGLWGGGGKNGRRRVGSTGGFGWDDALIVPPLLCAAGMTALFGVFCYTGLGHSSSKTSDDDSVHEGVSANPWFNAKLLFAFDLLSAFAFNMSKISALVFYLRVFPSLPVRRATKISVAILCLWIVGYVLGSVLVCRPVRVLSEWKEAGGSGTEGWAEGKDAEEQADPEEELLQCGGDRSTLVLAGCIFSIISDLVILIIPMPSIWGLNMRRGVKVGLSCVFSLGVLVIAVSSYRAAMVVNSSDDSYGELTFTALLANFAATLEPNITILCASMPMLWPLFGSFWSQSIVPTARRLRTGVAIMAGEEVVEVVDEKGGIGMARPAATAAAVPATTHAGSSENTTLAATSSYLSSTACPAPPAAVYGEPKFMRTIGSLPSSPYPRNKKEVMMAQRGGGGLTGTVASRTGVGARSGIRGLTTATTAPAAAAASSPAIFDELQQIDAMYSFLSLSSSTSEEASAGRGARRAADEVSPLSPTSSPLSSLGRDSGSSGSNNARYGEQLQQKQHKQRRISSTLPIPVASEEEAEASATAAGRGVNQQNHREQQQAQQSDYSIGLTQLPHVAMLYQQQQQHRGSPSTWSSSGRTNTPAGLSSEGGSGVGLLGEAEAQDQNYRPLRIPLRSSSLTPQSCHEIDGRAVERPRGCRARDFNDEGLFWM